MKMLFVFIAVAMLFNLSCKEDKITINEGLKCPVAAIKGPKDKIVGKWKLVRGQNSFTPAPTDPEDYSCDNIIYNFQPDGEALSTGYSANQIKN